MPTRLQTSGEFQSGLPNLALRALGRGVVHEGLTPDSDQRLFEKGVTLVGPMLYRNPCVGHPTRNACKVRINV